MERDGEGKGFGGENAGVAVGCGGVDFGVGWEGHRSFRFYFCAAFRLSLVLDDSIVQRRGERRDL